MVFQSLEGSHDVDPEIGMILPTCCEAENTEKLVTEIKNLHLETSILVIGDSSPDGTRAQNDLHRQANEIQIETMNQALLRGFKMREAPISFEIGRKENRS